jgi:Flagellin-specific chaperone FliS
MNKALFAYKNAEKMSLPRESSASEVLVLIMDELIKCVKTFITNISIKTGNMESKSKGFSKALSIIYTLQSSLDLEKGGLIASDLFKLYEFTRINLIKDMRSGVVGKSDMALNSLKEINNTWHEVNTEKV